jgi:hypothetical protein
MREAARMSLSLHSIVQWLRSEQQKEITNQIIVVRYARVSTMSARLFRELGTVFLCGLCNARIGFVALHVLVCRG